MQYAIEEKCRQTNTIHERLRGVIRSTEGANNSRISDSVLSDLVTTAEQFKAVITNTLLERMHETAAFSDNENLKLQEFADLCADIESQIAYLPGLAYLNFPNAIQPIVEKLPPSLRGKWEKEIANHYEKNAGAYPGFMVFSKVVQNQAKIKNNPNVHIGAKLTPALTLTPSRGALNGRALNTNTRFAVATGERGDHCEAVPISRKNWA